MIRSLLGIAILHVLALHTLAQTTLTPHTLTVAPGRTITLSLPGPLDIDVAATGLRRVRFLARSPDGRIFATGMYSKADNTQGAVFILEGWDDRTHRFTRVIHYLDHLRNPNNLAFYTQPAHNGRPAQSWLYLPLTDRLLRYRYAAGDEAPSSEPEILMRFPGYGLGYKYGGWHLTRTVAVATFHGQTRVYVAAGSSCNYCREREALRASVVSMDPDGSRPHIVAQGLRNAVDLHFVPELDGDALFATNMGDDHLGDKLPEDTFFELYSNDRDGAKSGKEPCNGQGDAVFCSALPPNYGWPRCYFAHGQPVLDTTLLPDLPPPGDPAYAAPAAYAGAPKGALKTASTGIPDINANLGPAPAPLTTCEHVPAAYNTFAAHSSPLGLAYFGTDDAQLRNNFLVALHGAGHPRIGAGYRVVRFTPGDRTPRDFITGFLTSEAGKPVVHGRPCGILRMGVDSFLLTDDQLGVIYFVHPVH